MASQSRTTQDHAEIQHWAEERGGKPAHVSKTGSSGDIGILRLEFPGATASNDANLEQISWDQFFEKFDERGLSLVYQEETAGGEKSNFNKLVTAPAGGRAKKSSARKSSPAGNLAARKTTAKKAIAKKAVPKKAVAKKAPAKKAPAKKAAAKKAAPKKALKKTAAKKKSTAKQTPAKTKTAKKAAAKKTVSRGRR